MFSHFLALVLPSSLPVDQSVALPLTCWLLGQGSSTLYSGSFCSLFWSLSPGFYIFIYCFVILMDSASPLGYGSFLLSFFSSEDSLLILFFDSLFNRLLLVMGSSVPVFCLDSLSLSSVAYSGSFWSYFGLWFFCLIVF